MAISPRLILEQARGSAPFLFSSTPPPPDPRLRYLQVLREHDGRLLDGPAYYELCLCAHWATAGSFLPLDVDNAIRFKLWQDAPRGRIETQARLVLEAARWDYTPVTARRVDTPEGSLSTHEGTWFSVAVGAYAACRGPFPALARELLEAMLAEAEREDRAFAALKARPLAYLKASALVAHNFGDGDRVMDQWELPPEDPLRLALYDAAKPGSPLYGGRLAAGGLLHQRLLSADNHRHYPLRAPRALRRAAELLLPVGPFFDDWGRAVARHPGLSPEEKAEVARALVDGWERLHAPPGYARALAGFLEAFPGGRKRLMKLLPGKDARLISSGPLKVAMDETQERFEARWAAKVRRL